MFASGPGNSLAWLDCEVLHVHARFGELKAREHIAEISSSDSSEVEAEVFDHEQKEWQENSSAGDCLVLLLLGAPGTGKFTTAPVALLRLTHSVCCFLTTLRR